ncbi:MAG: sulfocyanin-like copper-binding protein [Caldilineaceae bacterium]
MKKVMIVVFCCVVSLVLLAGCGSDDAEASAEAPAAAETTAQDTQAAAPTPMAESHAQHSEATATTATTNDPGTVTLDIDMHDSYYGDADTNMTDPPVWTVPKGSTILINLTNHGEENHNWAIVKAGTQVPNPFTEGRDSDILLLEPGMVYSHSQTQWVIYAPDPGEYEVICTVEGHFPFMRGKLVVTDK